MKVCVTGSNGFIGGAVVRALGRYGLTAIGFDRYSTSAAPEHFVGDVRDPTAVSEAVALADGVIHVAGVLGTAETVDNPWPAVETNIYGSLNVFQACRQHRRRGVYITVGNYWMHNAYSITKTTAEQLAYMFNREHRTEIAVVRALNAYGPGQKTAPVRKIIPSFVAAVLRGEPITVYGDGQQIMDMVYVDDVADVLVRALIVDHGRYVYSPRREDADNAIKFEVGSGRATTVNEIADAVIATLGRGSVRHVPMRQGEPERAVVLGDPETLRPLYGGEVPDLTSLQDGLERTVDWYQQRLVA